MTVTSLSSSDALTLAQNVFGSRALPRPAGQPYSAPQEPLAGFVQRGCGWDGGVRREEKRTKEGRVGRHGQKGRGKSGRKKRKKGGDRKRKNGGKRVEVEGREEKGEQKVFARNM